MEEKIYIKTNQEFLGVKKGSIGRIVKFMSM